METTAKRVRKPSKRAAEKVLAAENAELLRLVGEYMRARGVATGDIGYKWSIPTPLGNLLVDVHDTCHVMLGIYCRFLDVNAAKAKLPHGCYSRLNPYSGKWNFDGGSDEGDAANLFAHWQVAVQWVLDGCPEGWTARRTHAG